VTRDGVWIASMIYLNLIALYYKYLSIILLLFHTFYSSLQHALTIPSLLCILQLSRNGFRRRISLRSRVQRLLSSLPGACLTAIHGVTVQRLEQWELFHLPRSNQRATFCDYFRRVCHPTANRIYIIINL
jgi:hypothetical protein